MTPLSFSRAGGRGAQHASGYGAARHAEGRRDGERTGAQCRAARRHLPRHALHAHPQGLPLAQAAGGRGAPA
eukprot:1177271-Prorocentrum_minimum.AAC.1